MLLGKEFGPFVVDKELGSGAMGTVVRAKHTKKGKLVAIKLMSLALGTSEAAQKRFTREVEILRQLDHPNIVKYLGSGKYHGAPFYIMEYVEGESLDHILNREKKLPWERVIEIGMNLCAALEHAHAKGIIHRDLKPSNLMVLPNGIVKLTDFGIAKDTDVTALTAANSTVGTAAYMSPEQCRGVRDITLKTDLYSMGIMFYELLTGRKPFVGETPMEVFLQHANNREYKRPNEINQEIPLWLNELVCQLMEKDPSKRPHNAKAVADTLQLIKDKIEVQRRDAPKPKTKKTSKLGKAEVEDEEPPPRPMPVKKKKEPIEPFYTKGWFTISALAMIGIIGLVFVYVVFLRTASAESLYAEAESLLKTDAKAARDGPIALFLQHYPEHEKVGQVRTWADQFDLDMRDRQMHNRRKKFKAEETEEQLARDALDDEDMGRLSEASKRWKELAAKKGNANADMHAWGLVGERYAKELQKIEDNYQDLRKRAGPEAKSDDKLEQFALMAVRYELDAEKATMPEQAEKLLNQSKGAWDDLRTSSENDTDRRGWHLLALKRLREIRESKK